MTSLLKSNFFYNTEINFFTQSYKLDQYKFTMARKIFKMFMFTPQKFHSFKTQNNIFCYWNILNKSIKLDRLHEDRTWWSIFHEFQWEKMVYDVQIYLLYLFLRPLYLEC